MDDNEENEGAPDGTPPPQDRDDHLRKAIAKRDLYKAEAREFKAKYAELEVQKAELEKQLAAKAQLEKDFTDLKSKHERRNFEDQLLGDLPRAKRETASLLLDGLMARGEVSLDGTEESVTKARERLAALIPDFGSDTPPAPPQNRGPSPTPPSAPATQGVDPTSTPGFWSQYRHFTEVPHELRSKIPDSEWIRLVGQ